MATAPVSVEFQNFTLTECFDQGLASYESICDSTEPAKESGTQVCGAYSVDISIYLSS